MQKKIISLWIYEMIQRLRVESLESQILCLPVLWLRCLGMEAVVTVRVQTVVRIFSSSARTSTATLTGTKKSQKNSNILSVLANSKTDKPFLHLQLSILEF